MMELILRKLGTGYNKLHGPPSLPLPAVWWCAGELYLPHWCQIAVFSCDSSSVCCYGKCEVQSPSTIPEHWIITIQISTQYPPHLGFLPTGMVISGSELVFSISLTGTLILFNWNYMRFSPVDSVLCMFIFSISVFMWRNKGGK